MPSMISRLYRYTSLFGEVWYLTLEEARAKLAEETKLYQNWVKDFPHLVQEPRLDE